MPGKHDGFKDFVLDQLRDLRGVTCRAMFGGHGLSCRGSFFGIAHKGRLYFKVSPVTVVEYRAHNMKPFRATARMTLKSYFEVPADILEDSEALVAWAERAVRPMDSVSVSRSAARGRPSSGRGA